MRTWLGSPDSMMKVLRSYPVLALAGGALGGVALVLFLLESPFEIVDHTIGLRPLAEDLVAIAVAGLLTLAFAYIVYRGIRRFDRAGLAMVLVLVPILATLPILAVQVYRIEAEPPLEDHFGHPRGVPITNRASIQPVASDLEFPTSLSADSKGRLIVTEFRSGMIWLLEPDSEGLFNKRLFAEVPLPEGMVEEQGLWHARLDPSETYLYVSAIESLDRTPRSLPGEAGDTSQVVRFLYNGGEAGPMEVILPGLPAWEEHSGGALVFGPDSNLYLSVGDTRTSQLARVPHSLEGSILRFTPQGLIPNDNPTPWSPVYASGFRNPYGLAFHPETGILYATDNGPHCCDRLLRVKPGGFHGWPDYNQRPGDIDRMKKDPAVVAPLLETGLARNAFTQLWAYGGDRYGAEFKGNLFFGTFHDGALHRVVLSQDGSEMVSDEIVWGFSPPQSIVGVTAAADGYLYFTAANTIYRIDGFDSASGRGGAGLKISHYPQVQVA